MSCKFYYSDSQIIKSTHIYVVQHKIDKNLSLHTCNMSQVLTSRCNHGDNDWRWGARTLDKYCRQDANHQAGDRVLQEAAVRECRTYRWNYRKAKCIQTAKNSWTFTLKYLQRESSSHVASRTTDVFLKWLHQHSDFKMQF